MIGSRRPHSEAILGPAFPCKTSLRCRCMYHAMLEHFVVVRISSRQAQRRSVNASRLRGQVQSGCVRATHDDQWFNTRQDASKPDASGLVAPPTSSACTIAASLTSAGSSSSPKLAMSTSKVTLSPIWVKAASSKSNPNAPCGHCAGLSSHENRASRSIKRRMSQALATRSTQRCRRVA
jgi:hypothetical protein